MQDESKQLVELMLGDAEARLKRMKTSAAQVAKALVALREAEQAASDAIAEYMSASGTSKSQLIHDLALSNVEARLVGLIAPARARKHEVTAAQSVPAELEEAAADTTTSSSDADDAVHADDQQWGEYHG